MNNLSMYVPHIWKSELDSEATAFLSKYFPDAIKTPMCVPIEKIATEIMHLKVVEHHLSEDLSILGQMCFTDGMAEIYDPVNDEYREIFVKAGTMIIDPDTYAKRNLGSKRNTMAHESYHWFRHRRYHLMAAQLDNETRPVYRCPTVPKSESIQTEWTDEDWMGVKEVLSEIPEDKRVTLFVDIAYIDFAGDEDEFRSFLPILDTFPENVLPVLGFSASKKCA